MLRWGQDYGSRYRILPNLVMVIDAICSSRSAVLTQIFKPRRYGHNHSQDTFFTGLLRFSSIFEEFDVYLHRALLFYFLFFYAQLTLYSVLALGYLQSHNVL